MPGAVQHKASTISGILSEDFFITVGAIVILVAAIAALMQPMIVFSDAQPTKPVFYVLWASQHSANSTSTQNDGELAIRRRR